MSVQAILLSTENFDKIIEKAPNVTLPALVKAQDHSDDTEVIYYFFYRTEVTDVEGIAQWMFVPEYNLVKHFTFDQKLAETQFVEIKRK